MVSGFAVACICWCVCVSTMRLPRDNSFFIQARTAKFGQKMQNTLVKSSIVLELIDLACKSTFHYARLVHQIKYTTTRVNTKIIFNTPQFIFVLQIVITHFKGCECGCGCLTCIGGGTHLHLMVGVWAPSFTLSHSYPCLFFKAFKGWGTHLHLCVCVCVARVGWGMGVLTSVYLLVGVVYSSRRPMVFRRLTSLLLRYLRGHCVNDIGST